MASKSQSSSIGAEQKSLEVILADKRTLRVPAYQRSFSWTKSEIDDLLEDLYGIIYEAHDSYFFGSMVFILNDDNSLEVVDGQQRLATISLFLAAIRDGLKIALDDSRASLVETSYLCRRDLETMEPSPKLSLNEVDNNIYLNIIDSHLLLEDIKTASRNRELLESNRLIAKTYLQLYDYLKLHSDNFTKVDYLVSMVKAIVEKITCIPIVASSEESAYVLFETLNERGIELTLSDMLKNFLFSKAGRRLEEAKHIWIETMTLIGQQYMKSWSVPLGNWTGNKG